jgi:arylsulfatase A-like enzyme
MNTGACAAWEDGHEWRGLRDQRCTYAVYRGGGPGNLPRKELLFDHTKDPYQMKDLAGDPAHAEALEQFRTQLRGKMDALNDTFPACTWYRDNWIEDRIIKRTATIG